MGVILERKKRILLNEPHLVTTTPAGIASFSTDLIAPLKSCKVEFSPVQSGSGDPSPSNVRAISGWTGVNVYHTGKNLFDGLFTGIAASITYHELYVGDSAITASTTTPQTTQEYSNIFVFPGIVSSGASTGSNDIHSGKPRTVTPVDGYITIAYRNNYGVDPRNYQAQIEISSTATPYEPYTGSAIPIDWTSEAGTVYGGYVDVVRGELVKTTARISLDGSANWQAVGNKFYCSLPYTDFQNSTDISAQICNMYPFAEVIYYGSAVVTQNKHFYLQRHDEYINYCRVWVYDTGYSLNQFKALLNQTPLVFTYPVTESVVSLDPVTLKMLRGVNNIWSDTNGNTTVKYWAH